MNIKNCFGILATLFVLIAGIVGAITYFASAGDLENAKQQITKDTIQTFEKYQMKMDNRFNTQQLFLLKDREYKILEEIKRNPSNSLAKDEYKEVKQEIIILKRQINEDKGK